MAKFKNIEKSEAYGVFPDPFDYLKIDPFISLLGEQIKEHMGVREFSRLSGTSPGHLSALFSLKKELSEKTIESWSKTGIYGTEQILYLKVLLRFSQTENPELRFLLLKELNFIARNHPKHQKMIFDGRTLQYWFISSIRKYFLHPLALRSEKKIAETLRKIIPENQIKEAIADYLQAGALVTEKEGKLAPNSRYISWGHQDTENFYLVQFHKEMLKRTVIALADPFNKRDFHCLTFLANPTKIKEMKTEVNSFLVKFYEKFADESNQSVSTSSEIFQFNCQLFQTSDFEKLRTDE